MRTSDDWSPCPQASEAEVERLTDLVRWAYSKLHMMHFSRQEDALRLDEMKLLLEHGLC